MINNFQQLEISRGKSFPFVPALFKSVADFLTPIFGVGIELAKIARINLTPFYGVEVGVVGNDNNYKNRVLKNTQTNY